MREKILELADVQFGDNHFQTMIDNTTVNGYEGIDPETLPERIQAARQFIQEKLAAARLAYEDAEVEFFGTRLTEEDIDANLAFARTDCARKIRQINVSEWHEQAAKWRNETLEPHIAEVKKLMGLDELEPVPAPAPTDDEDGAKTPVGVPITKPVEDSELDDVIKEIEQPTQPPPEPTPVPSGPPAEPESPATPAA